MSSNIWPRAVFAAALIAAFFWVGCSEEDGFVDTTTILGTVVDAGAGIVQINVAIVYNTQLVPAVTQGPAALNPPTLNPATLSPAAVTLGSPYPNPATLASLPGEDISIPVSVTDETTLSVEIFGLSAGSLRLVWPVFEGAVGQDTTLLWDGRDLLANAVPNGLYVVRLTVPANPPAGVDPAVVEESLIVNRSTTTLFSLHVEGFNAQSGVSGEYVIDDIAVEEPFKATSGNGTPLGQAVLGNQFVLYFWDSADPPQYADLSLVETMFPGDTIEKVTELTRLP